MRLTQGDSLGFAIRAVFRQHQRSKGHRDDLLGLPAVRPRAGDLGQLQKIRQDELFSQLICCTDFKNCFAFSVHIISVCVLQYVSQSQMFYRL